MIPRAENKSILRPIKDGDDCTDIIVKTLVVMACAGVIGIMLVAFITMFTFPEPDPAEVAWRTHMRLMQEDAAREKQLRKKHGDQVIIYEKDRAPYYINKDGQKCRYM